MKSRLPVGKASLPLWDEVELLSLFNWPILRWLAPDFGVCGLEVLLVVIVIELEVFALEFEGVEGRTGVEGGTGGRGRSGEGSMGSVRGAADIIREPPTTPDFPRRLSRVL